MENIQLSSIINDDNINTVEIYFCKDKQDPNVNTINIGWDKAIRIPGNFISNEYIEYYQKNLICIYDIKTDGQKIIKKEFKSDFFHANQKIYIVAFNEQSLSSFAFSCADSNTISCSIVKKTYKINNRIYIHHDFNKTLNIHTYYLKYVHSDNIDLVNMQIDLNNAIQRLMVSIC